MTCFSAANLEKQYPPDEKIDIDVQDVWPLPSTEEFITALFKKEIYEYSPPGYAPKCSPPANSFLELFERVCADSISEFANIQKNIDTGALVTIRFSQGRCIVYYFSTSSFSFVRQQDYAKIIVAEDEKEHVLLYGDSSRRECRFPAVDWTVMPNEKVKQRLIEVLGWVAELSHIPSKSNFCHTAYMKYMKRQEGLLFEKSLQKKLQRELAQFE